jgi:general secretion pathway protein K
LSPLELNVRGTNLLSQHSRRWRSGRVPGRARQRGIALLVAILLVAIGTIIAASMAYENAMTARRGAATFAMDETVLMGEASEALAAYGLNQYWQTDKSHFYIGEGWDKPVGPIEVVPGVMLTAQLDDMAGRFNLNSLVNADGTPNKVAVAAFQQLLTSLSLEPMWAGYMVDWIDQDITPQNPDGAEDSVYMGQQPPYRTANMYITSTTELLALPGFGRDRFQKLAPYIVALPTDAKINICTAPGLVLDAFIPGRQEFGRDPDGLLKNRQNAGGCFPTQAEYQASFGSAAQYAQVSAMLALTSNYFRLTSFVTIDTTEFNLYSLLYLDAMGKVRPLIRTFTPD